MNPIKAARIKAGYKSAHKASQALGFEQGHYSRLEAGKIKPGHTTLLKLATAYGVTAGQLVGLEPIETPDTPAAS